MRVLVIAALALILVTGASEGRQALADTTRPSDVYASAEKNANRGPCFGEEFDVKHWMSADQQYRRVRRLIRCATDRWDVPGGYETALRIATCESSLYTWAASNGNYGLFQIRFWDDRARTWLKPAWFPFHWVPRWSLARANVLVAVRWAHRLGWGAWSCY